MSDLRKHRHRGGGFPIGAVFAFVVALHVVGAAGVYWLAKTTAGQAFAKQYKIKLFQEAPEPERQAEQEPPPPPPPKIEPQAPPPSTPQVAALPQAAPAVGGPMVGGGGWSAGGKFLNRLGEGPEGIFNASVMGRFRQYYKEPPDPFGAAELELIVSENGAVRSYRLRKSSGHDGNDRAILEAAARVQSAGVSAPPDGKPRAVTVRFIPTTS